MGSCEEESPLVVRPVRPAIPTEHGPFSAALRALTVGMTIRTDRTTVSHDDPGGLLLDREWFGFGLCAEFLHRLDQAGIAPIHQHLGDVRQAKGHPNAPDVIAVTVGLVLNEIRTVAGVLAKIDSVRIAARRVNLEPPRSVGVDVLIDRQRAHCRSRCSSLDAIYSAAFLFAYSLAVIGFSEGEPRPVFQHRAILHDLRPGVLINAYNSVNHKDTFQYQRRVD